MKIIETHAEKTNIKNTPPPRRTGISNKLTSSLSERIRYKSMFDDRFATSPRVMGTTRF